MQRLEDLTPSHCILLAAHYASLSNIRALRAVTYRRKDAFSAVLILQIVLTYLPESVEPAEYVSFLGEVIRDGPHNDDYEQSINLDPVKELTEGQARKRWKKLQLLSLEHPTYTRYTPEDPFVRFLVHRAHRIDVETGLLAFVPPLIVPFLNYHEYLRTWLISVVLPLLRLDYEYYPQTNSNTNLERFSKLYGANGVSLLLGRSHVESAENQHGKLGRDLKFVVGPWMYGYNERKRRRLGDVGRRGSVASAGGDFEQVRDLNNEEAEEPTHDWEYAFRWLVHTSVHHFESVAEAIEEWDGPRDVDLGGYEDGQETLTDREYAEQERRYAQAAFASCYAVTKDTPQTIAGAHRLLVRLASLLDFDPPPDLATSVELLPRIDAHADILNETHRSFLLPDALLQRNHPLTSPKLETFSLLQMLVYSAYILESLSYNMSIVNVAKLRFYSDEDDQLKVLQKILHGLVNGPRKDDEQWIGVRSRILWLWNWGIENDDVDAITGSGCFGKITRATIAEEILRALLATSTFGLAAKIYILDPSPHHRLFKDEAEAIILETVMQHYDNASNGNRTRGRMKMASDTLAAFRQYFSGSPGFRRAEALLTATHSLSFYSLTLQHGVPFKPVNIRVSKDPLSLIGIVLEQNKHSYTKVDDLISIGQNLVAAGLQENGPSIHASAAEISQQKRQAERRVLGMAIEAALAEDDFETAYSYVVNRLNPANDTPAVTPLSESGTRRSSLHSNTLGSRVVEEDDISWRAAYAAGRHRTADISSSQYSADGQTALHRLEKRMELLSQALLLAPPNALPEVLGQWRRCEEEMKTLLAQENREEQQFNDKADKRLPGAFLNATAPVQFRREIGRGASEETPMGLFDVARGAAAAIGRTAFPLRGAALAAGNQPSSNTSIEHTRNASTAGSETGSMYSNDGDGGRVRKRDMVANAVTGSLASGLGWVLGAQPVRDQPKQ